MANSGSLPISLVKKYHKVFYCSQMTFIAQKGSTSGWKGKKACHTSRIRNLQKSEPRKWFTEIEKVTKLTKMYLNLDALGVDDANEKAKQLVSTTCLTMSQQESCLTGGNWQKWKRVLLTCFRHKIYRDEAVGLKSCKYTWKITIFVKMWNLGQYHENLIFCQLLLNWSSNLKILLHMCETYNCDDLKHSTFRFNLIDFQLNTDFPSQFCIFYPKIT